MTIGEHIRQHRKAAGLTQKELGQLADISRDTVAQCERSRVLPGIVSCIALADALNLSLDELVGRDFKKE